MTDAALAADPAGRRLRRSKLRASALLLLAAGGYVTTLVLDSDGYVRAAAEAGMVGGLADWFAVVALFRRPLGLPIPHTALIPSKKRELGASLGSFVTENFLEEELVRSRIESARVADRIGAWLADPAHLDQAVDAGQRAVTYAVAHLDDEDLTALRPVVQDTLADLPFARLLGQTVHDAVSTGRHRPVVDLIVARSHAWLRTNERTVVDLVVDRVPWFLPRKAAANKFFREAVELAGELRADPRHPLRTSFDVLLVDLADELRTNAETQARIDGIVRRSMQSEEVATFLEDTLRSARHALHDALVDGDLGDQLRVRLRAIVQRLADDVALRDRVTTWVEEQLLHAVVTNRHQVVAFITETVDRWDAEDAARRIELQVGPDLQAIRINGTLVGALAGLLIHLATQLAV